MAGKKGLIIIVAALGLLSFGASFLILWMIGPSEGPPPAKAPTDETFTASLVNVSDLKLTPKQAQLDAMIKEYRGRKGADEKRKGDLDKAEHRLRSAGDTLKAEAEALTTLRDKVLPEIMRLQKLKAELAATRIRYAKDEQNNVRKVATVLAATPSEDAARMLENMYNVAEKERPTPVEVREGQELAVKVAYVLSQLDERATGKIFSAMSDPNLGAVMLKKFNKVSPER